MTQSTLPGTGPWSWLEPGLWVYRARELDLLGQADELLAGAAPAARTGGSELLEAKRRLHVAGIGAATAPAAVGGGGHRYVVQVGIQFLAGYRDLNLRDAAHVGHGALLAQDPEWHGRPELAAVIRGSLVGLATTEPATNPQGDPELAAVSTRAVRTGEGWVITGRKAWVSRVAGGRRVRGVRPQPGAPGRVLRAGRRPRADRGGGAPSPDGRATEATTRAWSWGDLVLDAVRGAADRGARRLGRRSVAVFRRHLAEYRPLVAATCLGAAAAAVDRLGRAGAGRAQPRRRAARPGGGAARRSAGQGAAGAGRAVHRRGPAGRGGQLLVEDGQGAGRADRDRRGPGGRARDGDGAGRGVEPRRWPRCGGPGPS